jgi:uncharacterized membrane protein (UPF0127 family)
MKMVFEILLLVIFVLVLAYLSFHFAGIILAPATKQSPENSVCFKPFGAAQGAQRCFSVELAKTSAEQEKGLMYRESLDENAGMLFIFNKEGIYPFWMKNTLIPLDMIWIDANNKVVFIGQNVQPCKTFICPSVVPSVKAKYVLEVNAGICQKIGLKVGLDMVFHGIID